MAEITPIRRNRRARSAWFTIILITIAYYICMFKGVSLDWFAEYAKTMLFILGFITGGLTITDAVMNWRNGNGGTK